MRHLRMNGTNFKGQALVEMAFILPVLLFFVFGIFEFGRAMYIKNTITHAARAGARAAIVTPNLPPSANLATCTTTTTNPAFLATCQSLYTGIKKENTSVKLEVFAPDGTARTTNAVAGDVVKVTATLSGFTSVVPKLIPVPTTISGNTAMRYE